MSAEPAATAAETDETEPTADDLVADAVAVEHERRLWLRAITPLIQGRSHDSDPSGRCQLAADLLFVSACEAARRVLSAVAAERPD